MKIVIWDNCMVVEELNFPGTTGPDLHIDPYNLPNSLSVRRTDSRGLETSTVVSLP